MRARDDRVELQNDTASTATATDDGAVIAFADTTLHHH